MSEQVCKNCGRSKHEHIVAWGHRYCTTDIFEPKPEPLKAKPGVRYRLLVRLPERGERAGIGIGLANGMLAIPNQTDEPMSPFWEEVPE